VEVGIKYNPQLQHFSNLKRIARAIEEEKEVNMNVTKMQQHGILKVSSRKGKIMAGTYSKCNDKKQRLALTAVLITIILRLKRFSISNSKTQMFLDLAHAFGDILGRAFLKDIHERLRHVVPMAHDHIRLPIRRTFHANFGRKHTEKPVFRSALGRCDLNPIPHQSMMDKQAIFGVRVAEFLTKGTVGPCLPHLVNHVKGDGLQELHLAVSVEEGDSGNKGNGIVSDK